MEAQDQFTVSTQEVALFPTPRTSPKMRGVQQVSDDRWRGRTEITITENGKAKTVRKQQLFLAKEEAAAWVESVRATSEGTTPHGRGVHRLSARRCRAELVHNGIRYRATGVVSARARHYEAQARGNHRDTQTRFRSFDRGGRLRVTSCFFLGRFRGSPGRDG